MVEHLETYLHHIFASRRVLGEWFLCDDNAVQTKVILNTVVAGIVSFGVR